MLLSAKQFPVMALPGYLAATLLWLLLNGAVLAAPGAHGPNGEHLDTVTSVNASGLMRLPDGSVAVPVAAQRRMAIRTTLPRVTTNNITAELAGWVTIHPDSSGQVQAINRGRLEAGPNGFPVIGQKVAANEILAYVNYQVTPYEFAREQNISSGLTAREALIAPVSGVIAEARVITGKVVDATEILFSIVNPQHLLIEAVTAQPGLMDQIQHAYLADAPAAVLNFKGAARIFRDGVLPLLFETGQPATALPLAIGQPVQLVAVLKEQQQGIVLPAEAIVRNNANEAVVWIKSGAERYIPQPVTFRRLNASQVVILQGLNPDNRVVIQGASLLVQIR